jgi:hypothetical protein
MADNITTQSTTPATAPDATTFATDDVGGVHYPRTKIDLGGDGAASPLVRGQQSEANSLPVALATEEAADLDTIATVLTALQKAEDDAHASTDKGIQALAVRKDTAAGLAADGDYHPLEVDSTGRLHVAIAQKAVKHAAAWVSRGTGLTTELNSLANGGFSGVGTAFDNTSNLDQFAAADIVLASLSPTTGAYLELFLVQSLDGSNYEDAPSSTNPGTHMLVARVLVTTGSGAKRIMTPVFRVPPGKYKLVLYNATNVSLASSANTVTLYTTNDALVA